MLCRHNPSEVARQECAGKIRDQMLAPWDPGAVVAFLQRYQKQEEKHYNKICGQHWDFKLLKVAAQRAP